MNVISNYSRLGVFAARLQVTATRSLYLLTEKPSWPIFKFLPKFHLSSHFSDCLLPLLSYSFLYFRHSESNIQKKIQITYNLERRDRSSIFIFGFTSVSCLYYFGTTSGLLY